MGRLIWWPLTYTQMANNIKGGAPNAVVAKSTVSFATAGITALNTEIIYLVDDPLKSYVPGRAINGISGFEVNKGYYLVAKTDMDLESILVPPVNSSQLAAPGSFTATQAGSTQINLSWAAVTNATGYVVDRATNSGFTTGVTLGIYTGSGTSYNNTGLTASTTYYYRIRATAVGYSDSTYSTANATTASASYDTDAQTLFAVPAMSGLSTTEKDAANQIIVDFKAAGIWTKHYAIWLIIGGTSGAHAVNAKSPGTYDFIFNGGWTHNSNGAKPNGTTGYADSQFCPFYNSSAPGQLDLSNFNSFNFAYYSGDNGDPTTDEMLFGASTGSETIQWDNYNLTQRYIIFGNNLGQVISTGSGTFNRLCEVNRTSNVLAKAFRDGAQEGTSVTTARTTSDQAGQTMYFAALNNSGSMAFPTARGMRFAAIAEGLTDSEITARKNAVNTFMTSLGRAV